MCPFIIYIYCRVELQNEERKVSSIVFFEKENTEDNGDIAITNGTKYSRMNQVKFVEDSLQK